MLTGLWPGTTDVPRAGTPALPERELLVHVLQAKVPAVETDRGDSFAGDGRARG
jgi:hypothetical protein